MTSEQIEHKNAMFAKCSLQGKKIKLELFCDGRIIMNIRGKKKPLWRSIKSIRESAKIDLFVANAFV
jgi:hypothetical protein